LQKSPIQYKTIFCKRDLYRSLLIVATPYEFEDISFACSREDSLKNEVLKKTLI